MTIRAGGKRLVAPAKPADAGSQDSVTAGTTPGRPPRSPVLRWCGLVWLGAFVVLLANDPGRMFFDTKLSVDLNPLGYYVS